MFVVGNEHRYLGDKDFSTLLPNNSLFPFFYHNEILGDVTNYLGQPNSSLVSGEITFGRLDQMSLYLPLSVSGS